VPNVAIVMGLSMQ